MLMPFNIYNWIEKNKELLSPPVGNKVLFAEKDFIIMLVGGPNERIDFHVNSTEEFFFQLKGNITLEIFKDNKIEKIEIKENEIFLLPPNIPHSPQRPKDSVGLVIEKIRVEQQLDHFKWYCNNCYAELHSVSLHIHDIKKQLEEVFKDYNKSSYNICTKCGHINGKN